MGSTMKLFLIGIVILISPQVFAEHVKKPGPWREAKARAVKSLDKLIADRQERGVYRDKRIASREKEIKSMKKGIKSMKNEIKEMENEIKEMEKEVIAKEEKIAEFVKDKSELEKVSAWAKKHRACFVAALSKEAFGTCRRAMEKDKENTKKRKEK